MALRTEPDPETAALAAIIGHRIRVLRRVRGVTLVTLAGRSRLSRVYIGELERGLRPNPTLQNLRRIADGLGVPVRELFPGADAESADDRAPGSDRATTE